MKQRMQEKKRNRWEVRALYIFSSHPKGGVGSKATSSLLGGKRITGNDGRVSAGDVEDHIGGVVSSWCDAVG